MLHHEPADPVDVPLTDAQRLLLVRGLGEWGGPAHCTLAMARAMGFESVAAVLDEGRLIARAIEERRPLSRRDWTRALLATEIVFASDVVGSGVDWPTTTGLDDSETVRLLRTVQRALGRFRAPLD